MKIIDIMKDSATLLGLIYEREILDKTHQSTEAECLAENPNIVSMFNLIKYSIRELCTNYVPVSTTITVQTIDKQCSIGYLQNCIRVQNVTLNSENVKFKIVNKRILFEQDGKYEINYATYPEILSMYDEIDFLQNFSPDVIVLGLCSYYALAHGMFELFEEMHEKYIEKAESLKDLKIFEIPCRRWS